jgi:hypothetical protein
MWNSTSRVTEHGTKYECPQIDALINHAGLMIQLEEDDEPGLEKDAECNVHYTSFLNGITNGEYFYALFQIFGELISDEPSTTGTPLYKEAILASVLDGLRDEFLGSLADNFFDEDGAGDIWELWKACRQNHNLPIWTDENDQPIEPPALKDIPRADWEHMLEVIYHEFLWDRDWELGLLGGNFALYQEQPHWPTHQEFRTAKTWFLHAYSSTRVNRAGDSSEESKKKPKRTQPKKPKS